MKIFKLKDINRAFTIALITTTILSCSDFLEENNQSSLNPDTFYKTGTHAESALNAVYATTREIFGGFSGGNSSNWHLLEAVSGQSVNYSSSNPDLNSLVSLSYNSNLIHARSVWSGTYKLVGNANMVIENVPAIFMSETRKKQILGEAYFLRAWAYFNAVRIWGDIPLITSPVGTGSADFYAERTSQDIVYDQIVSDLQFSEAAGLPSTDATGRVSLAAVKSLLAKVYLTMAGHPLNITEHYANAATKAQEVMNLSPSIGLFDTYGEIYLEGNENTVEHIFSVQYAPNVNANFESLSFLPAKNITKGGATGWQTNLPETNFYNSFESGDLRKVNRQGWFYTDYFTGGNGALTDLGGPHVFKAFNVANFGSNTVEGNGLGDFLNFSVIRFAEVLLIYAEASNEVSGPSAAAIDAVKRVRDRAGLTTSSSFTKDTFRELIWKERWHELCYERKTWFDMVRLRKAFNSITGGFDNFVGHTILSSNQTLQEKHLLFPIPALELVNNPNLTQNTGY
ncbi:RagB/SusD family nutrient uptake outer membrane protein [Flavobacteriaceae bacterium]|nr:RagB/SusD family nutrient uptake outer membrane protein [Flavobacteriaceae bacterium]MDA9330529.1 RagB/SusD family nutrient uptake outer membrane protein [Flavobacteriaceae bacterium]